LFPQKKILRKSTFIHIVFLYPPENVPPYKAMPVPFLSGITSITCCLLSLLRDPGGSLPRVVVDYIYLEKCKKTMFP